MLTRTMTRVLPLFLLLGFTLHSPSELTPARVLASMYDSIQHIRTLRMKVSALERIERKYLSANSEIKVLTRPRKVYFINRSRHLEVLYDSEQMPGKAL